MTDSNENILVPVRLSHTPVRSMSQGMLLKGSGVYVTSGILGLDGAGNLVNESFEAEVEALFEELGRTLAAAGLGYEHIARITYFIVGLEPSLVDTLRNVRTRYLNGDAPPASTLVGVAALHGRPRIEVEVIAAVP
ncbi:RidA family protein [Mesorhizobium sp. M0129]|uniref:RidA family protein n=1 Tax=Mesorhizobium sp. M0129 TaxID=2956886 RepID=UPI00333D8984